MGLAVPAGILGGAALIGTGVSAYERSRAQDEANKANQANTSAAKISNLLPLKCLRPLLFVLLMAIPASAQFFMDGRDLTFIASGASHQPDTLTWKALVISNGGSAPTEATLNAVDTFVIAVAGIKALLIWVDLIVPDCLIAAETPLYATSGLTLSTGNGWSGTLDTSGIAAGASIMRTGINPSSVFSTGDMGLRVYAGGVSGAPQVAWGGGNGGNCTEIYGTSNPNYHIGSYNGWDINITSATIKAFRTTIGGGKT